MGMIDASGTAILFLHSVGFKLPCPGIATIRQTVTLKVCFAEIARSQSTGSATLSQLQHCHMMSCDCVSQCTAASLFYIVCDSGIDRLISLFKTGIASTTRTQSQEQSQFAVGIDSDW